ncbi:malonate transporter subunit MadM [Sphingomonas psychrolutea]|uniref:Malonate transporter subunit MadM n=1 Tax=Sphingomonas psychrolutea TaxID=1259676 RepID=A0ABQ1G3Y3_9SPHN|nr:malonate transporter subunit MadM [Sphingomonas psychrolutea]GGA36990.1 malonate transporter subunit MadM [Sphingomonas psychrolutea]
MTGAGITLFDHVLTANALLVAFAMVGIIMWLSNALASRLTGGRIHGSAIAIIIGLALAFWGGIATGGHKGLSDIPVLSGFGLMGGAMLRDFAIVATACEVDIERAKRAGLVGTIALVLGTVLPFLFGAGLAWAFGYRDAVTISTIGAGAVTYIVGPVTGAALGAAPVIVTLSIGIGVVKSVVVMITTPLVARFIGLDNPRTAMVFGGMMGTVSGVTAGLAATDRRLVPYGALTATFHTGLGCLLAPSILYFAVLAVTG